MKLKRILFRLKNKSLFFKIYIPFVVILTIAIIILSVLGYKKRIGYLDEIKLNINETFQLNNLPILDSQNEDELRNYLLNNEMITNYSYSFRIGFYSKIFRSSDIYSIYPDLNDFPDYIKEVKMFNSGGRLGNLISDRIINEKIDNISYILKIKHSFAMYFLSLFISFFFISQFLNKYLSLFNKYVKISKPIQYVVNFNSLNKFIIKFIFSLLLTIIAAVIVKLFKFSDVNSYIFALIFISLCFLIISVREYGFSKNIYNISLSENKSEIIIYFAVLFLLLSITNTILELNAHNNKNFIGILIEYMALFFIFIIVFNGKYNNYISILLFIVSIILITYKQYSPAITDNYHYSSHFNSVFYVYNSVPYSKNMYSIHGHYALFMYPFLKIFGLSIKSYSILIAVLSGITSLCIILTIFRLIKSQFYRIIGIFITLFFLFTINISYTVFPLKLFFPSVMTLYISIINNSKNKLLILIGYILASFSVLWGADAGLVCLGSLLIANIYVFCYDLSFKNKKFYYNIAVFVILAVLSVLTALAILNICNICLLGGEKQSIKDLLFPLFTGQAKYTETHPKYIISYWIITIILFLFSFLYYIKDMKIFGLSRNLKYKSYSSSAIYCCACGLGLYCYFMNRSDIWHHMIAVSSLSVMIPFIFYRLNILLLYLKDDKLKNSEYLFNIFKTVFALYSIIAMFMSITSFINIYNPINDNFYKNMRTKNDEKNGISYIVTEYMEKYGFNGIPSFSGAFVYGYANLGWTNSLILPNESDWWNPSFGYSNAVKIFLDKKPDMFFAGQYLQNLDFYYRNKENESNIYLFNRYINMNYTNIPTEYEKYGFYLYKLK